MHVDTLYDGKSPPRGLVTKREGRFIPKTSATVALDVDFEPRTVRRRFGRVKCHFDAFPAACLHYDGKTHYGYVPGDPSVDLGTIWTVEFGIRVPDLMPESDETVLWYGTDAANDIGFHAFLRGSDGKVQVDYHVGAALQTIISTTALVADDDNFVSIRKNGAALELFLSGASDTVGASAAGANAAPAGDLVFGSRALNAAGQIPDSQFYCGRLSEVRWWNIARLDADILTDSIRQLPGVNPTPGLVHYWTMNAGPERQIISDSKAHIAQADLRDGFTGPCNPVIVPPEYPSSDPAVNPDDGLSILGGGARFFNGRTFHDDFVPPGYVEDILDKQTDGIHQFSGRLVFVAETLGGTLVDWSAGGLDGVRIDMDSGGLITFRTNDTVVRALPTTIGVALRIPYVLNVKRNDNLLTITVHNRKTGALLETQTLAISSGTGPILSGISVRRGAKLDGTDRFHGAISEWTLMKKAEGDPGIKGEIPITRLDDAVLHVGPIPRNRLVFDDLSDTELVPSCTPTEDPGGDDPDGPVPGPCVGSVVPTEPGFGKGIYDWKRLSKAGQRRSVVRQFITENGGGLWRADNLKGLPCAWELIYSGRSDARTILADFAQYRDLLVECNGVDKNLLIDRTGRVTMLGIPEPLLAMTGVEGGAGNLLRGVTYNWASTFYDPSTDHESNPSPLFELTIGAADAQVDLSAIPLAVDPDRANIQRRIYRSQGSRLGGGQTSAVLYRIGTITDNTTTTFTDNVTDADLVPVLAIRTDELGFYVNGVAPVFEFVTMFAGRIWGVSPLEPNRLYFSRIADPQAFPALYFLELADFGNGDPLTAVAPGFDRLYAHTENSIWHVVPTNTPNTFAFAKVVTGKGAAGPHSIAVYEGVQFFYSAGEQRFFGFDGSGAPRDFGDPIQRTNRLLNQEAMRYISSAPYQKRKQVWFSVSTRPTGTSGEAAERIPNNNQVYKLQVDSGDWSVDDKELNVLSKAEQPSTFEDRIYSFGYEGFLWLEDEGHSDGYSQTGDRIGVIGAGSDDTIINLDDHQTPPVAVANLPILLDGLRGVRFTLNRNGNYHTGIIKSNLAGQVTLKGALPVTPVVGDEWWIAGIGNSPSHGFQSAELDAEAGIHFKKLLHVTIQHELGVGNLQNGKCRLFFQTFQGASSTSDPPQRELDLTAGAPVTAPDKRKKVNRTSQNHRLGIWGPYPGEHWQIEGVDLEWARLSRKTVAT